MYSMCLSIPFCSCGGTPLSYPGCLCTSFMLSPISLLTALNHFLSPSQLQIFSQLMQQSPEILGQLGITPDSLREEMSKIENMEKLKVTCVFIGFVKYLQ